MAEKANPVRRWLLALVLAAAVQAAPAQEPGVAARVNGAEISVFRLERYFEEYLRQKGRSIGAIRNPTVYKRLKREALEALVDRELLVQEAQRRGLSVPAEEVTAARRAVEAGFRTPEAFRRRLEAAGFGPGDYDHYLHRELLARRTLEEMAPGAVPDGEEVEAALRQYRDALGAIPGEQARELVRRRLAERRRAEAERRALDGLRQGARLEILLPL